MKKIWTQNKTILSILIYAIFASVAVYFVFIPVLKNIKSVSDDIQKKIIDQELEDSRLNKLSQMEENEIIYKSNTEALDVVLKSENELEFIESIEAIAIKANCIITLNIGEKSDPKEINKMKKMNSKKSEDEKVIMDTITYTDFFPAQINLKGDYEGLVKFIKMLENSQVYVNIISIQINKETLKDENISENIFSKNNDKKEENKKETLNSSINAIVYTQK